MNRKFKWLGIFILSGLLVTMTIPRFVIILQILYMNRLMPEVASSSIMGYAVLLFSVSISHVLIALLLPLVVWNNETKRELEELEKEIEELEG